MKTRNSKKNAGKAQQMKDIYIQEYMRHISPDKIIDSIALKFGIRPQTVRYHIHPRTLQEEIKAGQHTILKNYKSIVWNK